MTSTLPASGRWTTATPTAPHAAPAGGEGQLAQAWLYPRRLPPTSGVRLQFNPEKIVVSHEAKMREVSTQNSSTNDVRRASSSAAGGFLTTTQKLEKLGFMSLELKSLVFDGNGVQEDCGKLLDWSYAVQSEPGGGRLQIGKQRGKVLPTLIFSWGAFSLSTGGDTLVKVIMTGVDITYERFSKDGLPIRATVDLRLQPQGQPPLRQNPTSGGAPDREGHLVTAGETLPGVAVRRTGRAGDWRRLAEANDVDDPLRVRPGTRLFIPSADDLDRVLR